MEYLHANLVVGEDPRVSDKAEDFLLADFASGENDRVPTFFIRLFPELLDAWMKKGDSGNASAGVSTKRLTTYSTDLHALRLDGLLGLFEENQTHSRARGVHTRLEEMTSKASFRPSEIQYLQKHPEEKTWLDDHILIHGHLPSGCFEFGILNNDVIGYLFEYYKTYTDAQRSLEGMRSTMKDGSLLVVAQPCSLYPIDNVKVLNECGFVFIEGMDFDLRSKKATKLTSEAAPEVLSRLGHYTFLVFQATEGKTAEV